MTPEQLASEELERSDQEVAINQSLVDIQFEIEMLTNNSQCNTDLECRTVAVGTKTCGGPEYFFAYSANTINVSELFGLVSKYNQLQKDIEIKSSKAEQCYMIHDPGAQCRDGRCILKYVPSSKQQY